MTTSPDVFSVDQIFAKFNAMNRLSPIVRGAVLAAMDDKSKSRPERAKIIADLFHVPAADILAALP